MIKRLVLTVAAVLLAACAGDPAGSTHGGLRAEPADGTAVAITNTGDQPVYYRIVNPQALASWMPCTSPADCPEIGGRQTVRIPHAAIELHQPDSQRAELYWWKFARIEGGYVTVDEGRLRIRL
ncbi:hypothetical protein [Longimicrobium sp.]|uniref:hypothetical protein n=1 Tax=Longimicrobium sp. TaxID=2029185 RepID=UPI003B3B5D18